MAYLQQYMGDAFRSVNKKCDIIILKWQNFDYYCHKAMKPKSTAINYSLILSAFTYTFQTQRKVGGGGVNPL